MVTPRLRRSHPLGCSLQHCHVPMRIIWRSTCGSKDHPAHVTSAAPQIPLFVFACGGTGGHITPALAVAAELQRMHPLCQVKFFGDRNGPEAAIVPKHGFYLEHMPSTAFHRPLLDVRNIWKAFRVLWQVAQHVRKLCILQPAAVVGTGCYAAFPACLAAAICGTPLFLIEPNAVPGLANRLLAPLCTAVFTSHLAAGSMLPQKKIVISGTPVRKDFGATDKTAASQLLNLGDQEQLLTVVGGSSGSNQLSHAIITIIPCLLHEFPRLHIHHQHSSDMKSKVRLKACASRRYYETTFFDNMAVQLAASDLVLSRAGALTCAEILQTGVPSVLWPLATSADGHQYKNAEAMVELGGSILVGEATGSDAHCSMLLKHLTNLLRNHESLAAMAARTSGRRQDSTSTIVRAMVKLVCAHSQQSRVSRPSSEDQFAALTGSTWSQGSK